MSAKPTLSERIDGVLNGKSMLFHDLAVILYPEKKAWRYSSNGGPPGCFMALSAGCRRGGFPVTGGLLNTRTVHPRSTPGAK